MSDMNEQALAVGDHDGRATDTGPEYDTAAHDGPGMLASGGQLGWRAAPRRRGSTSAGRPTWGEVFDERAPLIGTPAFFGPPVVLVVGPWLLLVLLLIGPFALILTVMLVLAVAAGLLALFAVVIASPYLLIRHLHAHDTVHAKPRAALHLFRKYRVSSRRPGSPQPKGVS